MAELGPMCLAGPPLRSASKSRERYAQGHEEGMVATMGGSVGRFAERCRAEDVGSQDRDTAVALGRDGLAICKPNFSR